MQHRCALPQREPGKPEPSSAAGQTLSCHLSAAAALGWLCEEGEPSLFLHDWSDQSLRNQGPGYLKPEAGAPPASASTWMEAPKSLWGGDSKRLRANYRYFFLGCKHIQHLYNHLIIINYYNKCWRKW